METVIQIPQDQLQQLRKEILATIQNNPFPDIALQGMSSLILGFTCKYTPEVNNPDNYDQTEFSKLQDVFIVESKNLDAYVFTVAHMPTLDITIITGEETLRNYINSVADALTNWIADKKERMVAGTLRLHWMLTPAGTIHGILYAIAKKVTNEG